MPLIRKIIEVGKTSKGLIIPKSWLEFLEKEHGQEITQVAIEVDKVLTVSPILPKKGDVDHE